MKENILTAIGDTPLIKLSKVIQGVDFQLFAKCEGYNPGGSIKDRPAYFIINSALEKGELNSLSTVVESSSGNMGIGLAQVCAYFHLPFICIVDSKTTKQNIDILKAYGAQVEIVTNPDPITGEYLQARINRVNFLLRTIKNSYWPNQYSNINNANAHHQTMHEIESQLNGKVDYLFCSTGTCGTIRGCSDYINLHNLKTKIWAVDARGSVIFGKKSSKRLIPGHGSSIVPDLCKPNMVDRVLYVSDIDCITGCQQLIKREAILAGGSSGGVITAIEKVKYKIPTGANCVAILPDRGERYLDTIYSDSWIKNNFGELQINH